MSALERNACGSIPACTVTNVMIVTETFHQRVIYLRCGLHVVGLDQEVSSRSCPSLICTRRGRCRSQTSPLDRAILTYSFRYWVAETKSRGTWDYHVESLYLRTILAGVRYEMKGVEARPFGVPDTNSALKQADDVDIHSSHLWEASRWGCRARQLSLKP